MDRDPLVGRAKAKSRRGSVAARNAAARTIQVFGRGIITNNRRLEFESAFNNLLQRYRQYGAATYLQAVTRGVLARRQLEASRARRRGSVEEMKEEGYLQEEKEQDLGNYSSSSRGGLFFPEEEGGGVNAGGLVGIPFAHNHAFGSMGIVQLPTGPVGDNHVPIYNFSVKMHVVDLNVDMNMVQRACLRALLDTVPILAENRRYAYGQVRLVVMPVTGMTNDLVTRMSPLNNISDEFEVTLGLYEVSETVLEPTAQYVIEFRYTFIFPENRQVTPSMVRATTNAFRSTDSRGGVPQINYLNTQARFMAMQDIRGRSSVRHIDTPLNMRRSALNRAATERRQMAAAARGHAIGLRRNERVRLRQADRAAGVREVGVRAPRAASGGRGRNQISRENQIAANNKRRRQKYHEQKDTRGVYQDFKNRIFHHTSLEQFFEHSKAVLPVPTSEVEGLCLAMALIRSEQRIYDLESFEIYESNPEATGSRAFRTFPFSDRAKDFLATSHHYSFLSVNEEDEFEGALFNTYKPMRRNEGEECKGALKYSLDLTNEEIQSWYFTAQAFVEYIIEETKTNQKEDYEEIDPNKEESFLQAVSDVLQIMIVVYRANFQGSRCNIYRPANHNQDIRKNGRICEVVSLLITDDHASSITNLREFVKNRSSANRMHIQNYCLVCEKVTTANNCTIDKCKEHFKQCLDKADGVVQCQSEEVKKKKYIHTYNPPQFTFLGKKQKAYCCRTCRAHIDDSSQLSAHVCYIARPEKMDVIDSYDIVVYDFESAQVDVPGQGVKQHDVNLVCCRNAYVHPEKGDERCYFMNIEDFMVWVLSQTTRTRTYIAHN